MRTNHVHSVVGASCRPEAIYGAFKANATRVLRERGYWGSNGTPWTRGGSTRYLWDERGVEMAVAYVVDGQGAQLDSL